MKKRLVVIIMMLLFLVMQNSIVSNAKDYHLGEEPLVSSFKLDKTDYYDVTDNIINKTIEKNIRKDNNGIGLLSEEVSDTVTDNANRTIYYGSLAGSLKQKDDYALYPVQLIKNEYLQVRLDLPDDTQLDYDLLLFDANLSLIKSSDYLTCTKGSGTLSESIGYIAKQEEKVYVCVYSVLGGSDTLTYILNYTLTTNFADSSEPNENAKEAEALALGVAGVKVTKELNSPLDNDWYSFTVLDSPEYDQIRLSISSSSVTNGCNIELYQNIMTNGYYAMVLYGSGDGGEITLEPGTYYLRIVSTNSFTDFNAGDIPVYELSISPVSKVDSVEIYSFDGPNAFKMRAGECYPEGPYYRIDEKNRPTVVTVIGQAKYKDSEGNWHNAANVRLSGTIIDLQWEAISRPDMSTVHGSTITDENGRFRMQVVLNSALGAKRFNTSISTHHYDFMHTIVQVTSNETIKDEDYFYLLKLSDFNGIR